MDSYIISEQQPLSWIQMASRSQNHLTWAKLHFYPWEARWAENPEGRPRQKLEQDKKRKKNKNEKMETKNKKEKKKRRKKNEKEK